MNSRAAQVYEALAGWESSDSGGDIYDFLDHVVASLTGRRLTPFLNQCRPLGEDYLVTSLSCALEQCYVSKDWLRSGDIVFWQQSRDSGLGVVLSSSHLATPSIYTSGLVWIAMDYAQFGWRVDGVEERSKD